MTQLEIKHLGRRFPYGLHIAFTQADEPNTKGIAEFYQIETGITEGKLFEPTPTIIVGDYELYLLEDEIKPIYHPLSDLTKPITHKGKTFTPTERLSCLYDFEWHDVYGIRMYIDGNWTTKITDLPYKIIEFLLEHHFVLDEPEGTWIDVNTLETNPYK